MVESFYTDYLSHCVPDSRHEKSAKPHKKIRASFLDRKSMGFPNIEEIIQEAVAEARVNIHSEYEEKYKEERAALEARLSQDTFVEGDTLYMSPMGGDTTSVVSMEMTMNDGVEMAAFDNSPLQQNVELETLKEENSSLASQVECFRKGMAAVGADSESQGNTVENEDLQTLKEQIKILKEQNSHLVTQVESLKDGKEATVTEEMKDVSTQNDTLLSLDNSVALAPQPCSGAMSLADELREAGMGTTFCNDTFETSVLKVTTDDPENESLKQKVEQLKDENSALKKQVAELQKVEKPRAVSSGDAAGMTATQDVRPNILEEELKNTYSEKMKLQQEIEKLKDELSIARMAEEEVHSLRWQVDTLKEENSSLEEDLRAFECGETEQSSVTVSHEKEPPLAEKDSSKECDEIDAEKGFRSHEMGKNDLSSASVNHKEQMLELIEKDSSSKDFEELHKLNEQLVEEKEALVREIQEKDSSSKELEELLKLNEKLVEEKKALVKEIQAYKERAAICDTDIVKEKDEGSHSSEISDRLESLCEENKSKESELQAKKDELECLKVELDMKVTLMKDFEEKCETLRESLAEKVKELEEAKNQLAVHQENVDKEKEEKLSEGQSLLNAIETKQKEILSAQERIGSLEQDLENQQKAFKEKLAIAMEEKESELEDMITNFMEKEAAFENEVMKLKEANEKTSRDSSTAMSKTEMESLQKKCTSLQNIIDNLESTVSKKESELLLLKEACQKLEADLADMNKEHSDQLQEMKGKIQSYEDNKTDQINDLEALRKKCEEKQMAIESTEEERRQMKEVLDATIVSLEEQKHLLKEKEEEREKLANSYEQLLNEKNTRDVEVVVNRENEGVLKKLDEFEELKNEFSAKVLECNQLKDSLSNLEILKARNEEKLSQLDQEHQEEVASYIKDLDMRGEQIRSLESEVREKGEKVASLTSVLDVKENKMKHLQNDIEEMKHCSERTRVESEEVMLNSQREMSDKVNELESEIERLTRLSDEVNEDRKKMMEALTEKEQEVKDVCGNTESLKTSLRNLEEERDNLHSEVLKKTEEAHRLESEQEGLKQELHVLKEVSNTSESLKASVQSLKGEKDNLNSEVLKKTEDLLRLESELERLKQEIQILMEEKSQLQDHLETKETELMQIEQEKHELKTEQEKMREEKQVLETEQEKMKKEKQVLETEQEKMREQISDLNSQVKSLNEQQEVNNQYIEKLVGLVEKFETDVAAKDNQLSQAQKWEAEALAKEDVLKDLKREADALTTKISEVETAFGNLKCENEELKKTQSKMEKEAANNTKKLKDLEQVNDKVALAEDKVYKIQTDYDNEIEHLKKELSENVSEKEVLTEKLAAKEEELQKTASQYKGEIESLYALKEELDEKKCTVEKLTSELDSFREELRSLSEVAKMSELKILQQSREIQTLKADKEAQAEDYKKLHESTSQQIESLVKIVEKVEMEMSEKQEQLKVKDLEHKNEIADREEMLRNLTLKVENIGSELREKEEVYEEIKKEKEELLKKICELESKLSNMEISHSKVEHQEVSTSFSHENKDLQAKLSEAEEKLKSKDEELLKTLQELEEKKEECLRLDAELDEVVGHYKNEGRDQSEVISSLTQDCKRVEEELMKTKEKLLHSSQVSVNASVTESSVVTAEGAAQDDTNTTLREELTLREQECLELNKELDEMLDHFRNEEKMYKEELSELREKFERTQIQLSETRDRLQDATLTEETLSESGNKGDTSLSDGASKELRSLKQQKVSLEDEVATLKMQYFNLKEKYGDMEVKYQSLEQDNDKLKEEVKIGCSNTDTLLEKLGDLEKLQAAWINDKDGFINKMSNYEKEIQILKKSLSDESAGEQINELLKKVKFLEAELQGHQKNFESVAEECASWKLQYTKQFEECENLKEIIRDGKVALEKQKLEYEEKIGDLSTHINTVMNKTLSSNTSAMDVSSSKKRSKVAVLEEQRDMMAQQNVELIEKFKTLENHFDNLRRSGGVVSYVEDFDLQLSLMKKKLEEVEGERDALNRNFDILEKEYEELQKERENVHSVKVTPTVHTGDSSTTEQLQR